MKVRSLIVVSVLIMAVSAAFAQDERITLSTYYPAPYGEYESLSVDNSTTTGSGQVFITADPGYMVVESKVGIGTIPLTPVQEFDNPTNLRERYALDVKGRVRIRPDSVMLKDNSGSLIYSSAIFLNNGTEDIGCLAYSPAVTSTGAACNAIGFWIGNVFDSDADLGWQIAIDDNSGDVQIGSGANLRSANRAENRKLTVVNEDRNKPQVCLYRSTVRDAWLELGALGSSPDISQPDGHQDSTDYSVINSYYWKISSGIGQSVLADLRINADELTIGDPTDIINIHPDYKTHIIGRLQMFKDPTLPAGNPSGISFMGNDNNYCGFIGVVNDGTNNVFGLFAHKLNRWALAVDSTNGTVYLSDYNRPAHAGTIAHKIGLNSSYGIVIDNTSSSSIRYKKDIRDMKLNPEDILDLRPVRFKWKESGEEDFGLIAEDVEKSVKDLVTYNEKNQPESVKYDKISIFLIELAKEQQNRIEELEKKVAELERK